MIYHVIAVIIEAHPSCSGSWPVFSMRAPYWRRRYVGCRATLNWYTFPSKERLVLCVDNLLGGYEVFGFPGTIPMTSDSNENSRASNVAVLHDNTASPRDDRRTRGKALRAAFPHKDHAVWRCDDKRVDPLQLLEQSNEGRIGDLIPIRFGRMLKSPFTFFRGAASIMAADLGSMSSPMVKVQSCGDCHALNFGAFATPERNVVLDINDFDETLPAPWEWDLKRLAVSLLLIARDNGIKEKLGLEAVQAAARAYRTKIEEYSHMAILDIWYSRVDYESVIQQSSDDEMKKTLKDGLKKAQKRTVAAHYFPKMTQLQNDKFVIKDNPPLVYHLSDPTFLDRAKQGFELYKQSLQEDKQRLIERYRPCDVAIKVVGIGSVGTTCAIVLLMGPDNEPLFLQVKEAKASVLEPYSGKSQFENHGQRVVAGQRIMQSASDIFLGWMQLSNGKHFYVRQLRDTKIKLEPESWDAKKLTGMAGVLGSVLARAHARSGDSAVINGYLGDSEEFDAAIGQFAAAYADQTERDHQLLEKAVSAGKIKVVLEQ